MKYPFLPLALGVALFAIVILFVQFGPTADPPVQPTVPTVPSTKDSTTPPLRMDRPPRSATSPTTTETNRSSEPSKSSPTPSSPPANPETGPYLKDPSEAVLKRLETYTSRRDASALLNLVRTEHSLARYEALQQHLDLVGPSGLPKLLVLLQEERDPALHELLQEALAAGGNSSLAETLARDLDNLPSTSARMAAALGIVGIGERESISQSSRDLAINTLEILSAKDPELAPDACDGLSESGESGLASLERLASNRDLEESSRLTAAEALQRKQPHRARRYLEELAREGNDPEVRQMAKLYLERSDGN